MKSTQLNCCCKAPLYRNLCIYMAVCTQYKRCDDLGIFSLWLIHNILMGFPLKLKFPFIHFIYKLRVKVIMDIYIFRVCGKWFIEIEFSKTDACLLCMCMRVRCQVRWDGWVVQGGK